MRESEYTVEDVPGEDGDSGGQRPAGRGSTSPQDTTSRAFALFAEAERLDQLARYDEAFALLSEANRLTRSKWDPDRDIGAYETHLAWVKSVFTPQFISQHQSKTSSRAPIFIVGLPRSGSTLVEQILASHPQVTGMGETDAMGRILREHYPLNPVGPFDPPAMAQAYLDQIQAEGWRGRNRFTDKRLPNFAVIGLLQILFPKAVIVHVVRDPLDTCFANYRRLFGNAPDGRYTYDMTELARQYRAYRTLMDHWSFVLMGRILTIQYEAVVADLEGQVRRLLKACGLPWHARCLRFYETQREVRTMSAAQVRQPIFAHSVGRWRQYERHLAPLIEALGPYTGPPAPGRHAAIPAPRE